MATGQVTPKSFVTRLRAYAFVMLTISLAVLTATGAAPTKSLAGEYYADHTGYADGNEEGYYGVVVYSTYFAHHVDEYCPDDPSTDWGLWHGITEDDSITFHTSTGNSYEWSDLTLADGGNTSCSEEDYWVDVYFGRWQQSGYPDNCDCGGVCVYGVPNSCDDAWNFGRQYDRGYSD